MIVGYYDSKGVAISQAKDYENIEDDQDSNMYLTIAVINEHRGNLINIYVSHTSDFARRSPL